MKDYKNVRVTNPEENMATKKKTGTTTTAAAPARKRRRRRRRNPTMADRAMSAAKTTGGLMAGAAVSPGVADGAQMLLENVEQPLMRGVLRAAGVYAAAYALDHVAGMKEAKHLPVVPFGATALADTARDAVAEITGYRMVRSRPTSLPEGNGAEGGNGTAEGSLEYRRQRRIPARGVRALEHHDADLREAMSMAQQAGASYSDASYGDIVYDTQTDGTIEVVPMDGY